VCDPRTLDLMTHPELIDMDAVSCPSCQDATQLEPVYRCGAKHPRSDVLVGLACRRCWPLTSPFPERFDDERWA
jgi:hypothetical protein